MREKKPRLMVIWGRYDLSFDLGEPERYRQDVPNAEVHVLDAGHFALDTAADAIAALVQEFVGSSRLGLLRQERWLGRDEKGSPTSCECSDLLRWRCRLGSNTSVSPSMTLRSAGRMQVAIIHGLPAESRKIPIPLEKRGRAPPRSRRVCIERRPSTTAGSWRDGGASRARTDDLIVANDALSQLSYSPT